MNDENDIRPPDSTCSHLSLKKIRAVYSNAPLIRTMNQRSKLIYRTDNTDDKDTYVQVGVISASLSETFSRKSKQWPGITTGRGTRPTDSSRPSPVAVHVAISAWSDTAAHKLAVFVARYVLLGCFFLTCMLSDFVCVRELTYSCLILNCFVSLLQC